jgi:deoxyribose-phosphate aldolase
VFIDEGRKGHCLSFIKNSTCRFVKTSTGFSTGGATEEDVALMRKVVGDEIGVKASAGIRSREDAEKMIAAGANRLGTSSGMKIISG